MKGVVDAAKSPLLGDISGDVPSRVHIGFETARLRLAEIHSEGTESRFTAYRVACEQSARTLGVERVSVWMFEDNRSSIHCTLQYVLSSNTFSEGDTLKRDSAVEYFTAVQSRRVIVVSDALRDPLTAQMHDYLVATNVGALLDAPIYRDGEVIGVVCHEHVGQARTWTEKEAGFASAVADMLTILIEQAERAELRAAIDAQRHMEAQNQKMQALVKLARVVTHDLSNLLTIASLRTDTLHKEQDIESARQEIAQVLNYGNELLRQLKDFCDERGPTGQVLVRETLQALEPVVIAMLGKDINFTLELPEEEASLPFSRIEFEQVIMNLVGNARDATTKNGRIGVKVWLVGPRLHLEVTDNGRGMLPITRERLFEPFYTTKSSHTGIGLAAVYGIVQRANGQIDVTSTLGEGTTFQLSFPVIQDPTHHAGDYPWELGGP